MNDQTQTPTNTPRIGRRAIIAGVGATAVTAVVGVGVASSASAAGFHYPKLRPGAVHYDNVLLLKSWLKKNGYNPTYGSQTAHYDRTTQRLVQHFQVRCALKTDAIVGPKTWCALVHLEPTDAAPRIAAVRRAAPAVGAQRPLRLGPGFGRCLRRRHRARGEALPATGRPRRRRCGRRQDVEQPGPGPLNRPNSQARPQVRRAGTLEVTRASDFMARGQIG